MSYQIVIPRPVEKQLDSIPETIRIALLKKILALKENPRPRGCAKLKGYENEYRIRLGDHRVRYQISDAEGVVVLLHCMHRKDIYRR